jgi:hypothetical protein
MYSYIAVVKNYCQFVIFSESQLLYNLKGTTLKGTTLKIF